MPELTRKGAKPKRLTFDDKWENMDDKAPGPYSDVFRLEKPGKEATPGQPASDGGPTSFMILSSCSSSVFPGNKGAFNRNSPNMQPVALQEYFTNAATMATMSTTTKRPSKRERTTCPATRHTWGCLTTAQGHGTTV
jgi:hypothetical protein